MIIKDIKIEKDIRTNSAESFSAPKLKKGSIFAYSAKTISVPNLIEAECIYADSAKEFLALELKVVAWGMYAESARSFSTPKLKDVWNIWADSAKKFSAPKLIKASEIRAYSAETIEL